MAIVARKTTRGVVFNVVVRWRGKAHWERSGTDRRAAERLNRKRLAEVRAGTYRPPEGRRSETVRGYAERWLDSRKVRSVADERRWLDLHVLSRDWLASMRLDEVEHHHVEQLVDELRAGGGLTDKSIGNAVGVIRTMFEHAIRRRLMPGPNPATLPRGTLKRARQSEPVIYTPAEIRVLTRLAKVQWADRVLLALCLYAGLREGEAAGRRWRDLDASCDPLWALDVRDQYGGQPLKTERPRLVPVHPELAELLEAWGRDGWPLLMQRRPTPDDFIVPLCGSRARTPHHTKSTAYKAFRRACRAAGVTARGLHTTRHTFISLCRRGKAREDVLERVTHNSRGSIVDRYTQWDWEPLCEAVLAMALDESVSARQHRQRHPSFLVENGSSGSPSSGPELLSSVGELQNSSGVRFPAPPPQTGRIPAGRDNAANNPLTATSSEDSALDELQFVAAVAEHAARAEAAGIAPLRLPGIVKVALYHRAVALVGGSRG